MVRLQKAKMKIAFSLGMHGTRTDARMLSQHVRTFRPHIYISEDAGGLEAKRRQEIIDWNAELETARKNAERRKNFIEKRAVPNEQQNEFEAMEWQVILDTYRLRIYTVEGKTEEEWKKMMEFEKWKEGVYPTISLLIRLGRIEEALEWMGTAIYNEVRYELILRNKRIVEGFERMLEEVPELFPGVEHAPELRIFARYGSSHLPLVGRLKDRGFEVETRLASEIFGLRQVVDIKLSSDPGSKMTESDVIRALFGHIYLKLHEKDQERTEEDLKKGEQESFGRVGKEHGFIERLKATATRINVKKMAPETFWRMVLG